jgi:hypothetical protein
MSIDFTRTQECLKQFEFHRLFVEELGWSQPGSRQSTSVNVDDEPVHLKQIAQLSGVVVMEVTGFAGVIPNATTRAAVHKEVSRLHHENLLIFMDSQRTQSLWYWVKRQDGKPQSRDHYYMRGQPGDLFISKLSAIVFDISEFDEAGNVPVIEVASRLRKALDVERVIKRFFTEFKEQHLAFQELIEGIKDDRDRRWYASVLLHRLMFIYFLQKKGFLDSTDNKRNGNQNYLQDKLVATQATGKDRFYSDFLRLLFFEGFAKPDTMRSSAARKLLGEIKYLNGGLFLPHRIETDNSKIRVPDKAFANLFALFARYTWNLNDTPGGDDKEMNPDVLGYIFEKYINQKEFGAYYTRPEITEYLCDHTIHHLILDAVNQRGSVSRTAGESATRYDNMADLLMGLDAPLCTMLLHEVLPSLSLLDPACGSGAFLVAAMKTLINVYSAVIGKIKFLSNPDLSRWLTKIEREHKNIGYFIKKQIITNNLYGVDIMPEAADVARLRLFLALVSSSETVEQLEPLPNIDFNIVPGNSLVGLLHVDEKRFEQMQAAKGHGKQSTFLTTWVGNEYRSILEDKNKSIELYRKHAFLPDDMDNGSQSDRLLILRDHIDRVRQQSYEKLNPMLLGDFADLGIQFEQATWDAKEGEETKPKKRAVSLDDVKRLMPFHWGFEFDKVLTDRGGFDAIITNPPWEIFKPNDKEFFEDHSDLVSKKKMSIHDFEQEKSTLLRKYPDVREAYLDYLSSYPHVSAYFRSAPQYRNQISIVNGKKAGSDINLYKLFTEQCFNLLRQGGRCGIIIPSGIYTDLGTKQLREVLFGECSVDTLFGLSNERYIFEGVHHAQKFCLLVFGKGGITADFEAAFRINPREAVGPEQLDDFLNAESNHVRISAALVRELSPDSLSVTEFRTPIDVQIAGRVLRHPSLAADVEGKWKFSFAREFDMTNASGLFLQKCAKGTLPLVQGNMVGQFDSDFAEPKYWIRESEGRKKLLARALDEGQRLAYQDFRVVHRRIASSTNERTLIAAVLPPGRFCADTAQSVKEVLPYDLTLYLTAIFNSFAVDAQIRARVSQHLDMHFMYALRIPRLDAGDPPYWPIVRRAARLVCATPTFDALAKRVGLKSHQDGAIEPIERAKLRAELDGLVAHLYGLTEDEFAHVLSTFPLVDESAKLAARNAYRDVERGLVK